MLLNCTRACFLLLAITWVACWKAPSPPAHTVPTATLAMPSGQPQPKLQTLKVWLGAEEMKAEIAITESQVTNGMMFRMSMAEDEGMLFVFPVPHRTAFWMKNTVLPLSCAYIDPEGVILELHELNPHDEMLIRAASDQVQYVLETKQGWFGRHGVNVGALVRTERGTLRDTFFTRK
jgi:uncharacterized membrane protein (UPF0127 family)